MKRTVMLVILLAITIISLGLAVALQGKTLVEWWKPAAVCLVPAIIAAVPLVKAMSRLTGWNGRWLNGAAMSILLFSLISGAFYTINFYKTTGSSAETYYAEVTQKFTQDRYDTKRVGRRTVRGEKRKVYNVVIKLPDESTKTLAVTAGQYAKTRIGQKFSIQIEEGFFGLPVMKHIGFPDVKNQKRNNKFNKQNSKTI